MEDLLTLARTPDPTAIWDTLGRVLLVVVAAIVLLVLGLWLKRRIVGSPEPEAPIPMGGFGMSELRKMRDRGELSEEEFERARAKLVARAKAHADAEEVTPDDRPQPKDLDLVRDIEP